MTLLGGSAEYHLKRFLNILKTDVPEIESLQILWFDASDAVYQNGKYLLNKENLKNLDSLSSKLDELSRKGKSWINIYGEGKITDDIYIVSIHYNLEGEGARATSINASGAPINLDGSRKMNASVKLVD